MQKTHFQRWTPSIPLALVALLAAVAAGLALASGAAAATITGHVRVQESGHIQEAWSSLDTTTNTLTQTAHTQSYTWFGGFTGGVRTILYRADGMPIGTAPQAYGVNGTVFGNSDRWDTYTYSIPPDVVAATVRIEPQVYWAPTWGALGWALNTICTLTKTCLTLP
jgi:hypothetical protein